MKPEATLTVIALIASASYFDSSGLFARAPGTAAPGSRTSRQC